MWKKERERETKVSLDAYNMKQTQKTKLTNETRQIECV